MKYLVGLVLILLVAAGGAWIVAGRMAPPAITVEKPEKFVGTATPLQVAITAPDAPTMKPIRVVFEQNGKQTPLFNLDEPGKGQIAQDGTDKVRITQEIGKQTIPDLQSGAAKIIVTAGRPVLRGMRTLETTVTHDVQVRLERPRVSVISTHHYINLGGTEIIVYRATPGRRRVGRHRRRHRVPGIPGGRGDGRGREDHRSGSEGRLLRAALRPGRERPDARLRARRGGQHRARRLRPPHVPEAVQEEPHSARRQVPRSRRAGDSRNHDRGQAGWRQPREVPRRSTATCGARTPRRSRRFAKQTSPELLWKGVVFHAFRTTPSNRRSPISAPTSTRARKSTSRCTSASISRHSPDTPIVAANRGKVLFADELGIYGNCVIIDHGMGVQSLYAHLSSIDVKAGHDGRERADARPQRDDRARRRRSPALHDARQRSHGESCRMVGRALDRGSDPAQASRHHGGDELRPRI